MTWQYAGQALVEIPEGIVGFVYLITQLSTGRQYIGKKLFQFSRTKVVKGKRRCLKVESDWQTYYGSNDELKGLVKTLGESDFRREILHLCKTKSECNYLETHEIFARQVLLSENFFNSWVSCKIHKAHVLNKLQL